MKNKTKKKASKRLRLPEGVGKTGEGLVEMFLVKRGFAILDRNYRSKYGELDIVAERGDEVHFFEVKSVSCKTLPDVTHETSQSGRKVTWSPEENIDSRKCLKIRKTIKVYLLDKPRLLQKDLCFGFGVVFINQASRVARVMVSFNVVT